MTKTDARPLAWESDEYGTSMLRFPDGSYVWLQARQPYCDRGHWEWGSMGLPCDGTEPSYYFMTLEHAREQVKRWVDHTRGISVPPPDNTPPDNQLFSHPVGQENGWRWIQQPHKLLAVADQARLELSWASSDPSSVVLTASGIDTLDESDRFPRHYQGLATAVAEVEAFLAWRLRQVPAEIPGPLSDPPRPPMLLPEQLPTTTPPARRARPR